MNTNILCNNNEIISAGFVRQEDFHIPLIIIKLISIFFGNILYINNLYSKVQWTKNPELWFPVEFMFNNNDTITVGHNFMQYTESIVFYYKMVVTGFKISRQVSTIALGIKFDSNFFEYFKSHFQVEFWYEIDYQIVDKYGITDPVGTPKNLQTHYTESNWCYIDIDDYDEKYPWDAPGAIITKDLPDRVATGRIIIKLAMSNVFPYVLELTEEDKREKTKTRQQHRQKRLINHKFKN